MKRLAIIFVLGLVLLVNAFSQENKTVTITVSGDGSTKQEALQVALRNAIEQAFGTFISSNTTILNDELVKDEIVSVTNGNIQDYSIISELQTNEGIWQNTVKANVSINKLTSFCESKGISAEFKGSLFALNIKQQELNEKNEVEAIKNMCVVLKELSESCFDYKISVSDPKQKTIGNLQEKAWDIPITISISPNSNLKGVANYFMSTLSGLSMNDEDRRNYISLNKKYYEFNIISPYKASYVYDTIYKNKKKTKIDQIIEQKVLPQEVSVALRNAESIDLINDFLNYFRKSICNFKVSNDIEERYGHDFFKKHYNSSFHSTFLLSDNGFFPRILKQWRNEGIYETSLFFHYDNSRRLKNKFSEPSEHRMSTIEPYTFKNTNSIRYILISQCEVGKYGKDSKVIISFFNLNIGKPSVLKINYDDVLATEELYKISGYKIDPVKNRIEKLSSGSSSNDNFVVHHE